MGFSTTQVKTFSSYNPAIFSPGRDGGLNILRYILKWIFNITGNRLDKSHNLEIKL